MAGYSINQILNTLVVAKSVSRIAATTDQMLNLFGMQPGGFAERRTGHRKFNYDVFNDARSVSLGRAPGTPAGTARRNPVGTVAGYFPRFYEKLPLLAEEIHNFRAIGGPTSVYDEAGRDYLAKQEKFMGQRVANARKVLLGGMLRGNLYGHKNGDDVYWNFTSTSAAFTVNYQMDSGNTNQLNMSGGPGTNIIDVAWSNSTANIPNHLAGIDSALQSQVGSRLDLIICRGGMWQNCINNDYCVSQAGVANTPFITFERQVGTGSNGKPLTQKLGRLAAVPYVTFIITDEGLDLGTQANTTPDTTASYTPYIGTNNFWFGPNPSEDFFEMILGSEPINEGPNMPEVVRFGMHSWITRTFDPTGYALYTLDNALATNYVPLSNGYATSVF